MSQIQHNAYLIYPKIKNILYLIEENSEAECRHFCRAPWHGAIIIYQYIVQFVFFLFLQKKRAFIPLINSLLIINLFLVLLITIFEISFWKKKKRKRKRKTHYTAQCDIFYACRAVMTQVVPLSTPFVEPVYSTDKIIVEKNQNYDLLYCIHLFTP